MSIRPGQTRTWHCAECGAQLEMYLNHVGDCGTPGDCSGSFQHPHVGYPPTACEWDGRVLAHARVTMRAVGK